jgi:branched-chain amino acid transport system substrate-binding protein
MSDPRALSRRGFLQSVALVVGGSLLAACQNAATAPPAAPTTAAASKPAAAPTSAPAPTTAPAAQTAGSSVTIGAVMPLTGRYASLAEQVKNGYDLAFEDLNKTSKMQLQLKVLDDASDPTNTVQRIESLSASDNPLALLGGAGSDLHAAAAAVADKNKVPYIGIAFALLSVHQRGLKYLFSPFQKSPQLAKTVFDMMDGQSPKPTRIAIFAEKTDWGAELDGLWQQEAKGRGYEVVADEQYTPGATDYSAPILKAKSANAEVLLALPAPPDGMAIAKQMKELDFMPKLAHMVRAPDGLVWGQNLGKDGDWFVLAPGWHPDVKFPGAQQLAQVHQTKYNKPAEVLVGPAYSAVQVLFDAVNRAGKADRDAVRDALAATDMMTVAGPIKFNADGTAQAITVMDQWLGGKQVLVWPKDQATQPLDYPAKAWNSR